ncbi:MAG: aminoglycoside phosphotransferase family protein [Candidatus Methanofastidiosa archaeon]|nr:aminoglycoside phosphotransferase family protein [Candidatus Methanofastidiosa archaeon]
MPLQDWDMIEYQIWIPGTEHLLNIKSPDLHFSSNTLWSATTRNGEEVVLKCFSDQSAFNTERTAYSILSKFSRVVDHFIGATCFNNKPTLVFHKLFPINWVKGNWQSEFLQILLCHQSLLIPSDCLGETGCLLPKITVNTLLSPLSIWLGEKKPCFFPVLNKIIEHANLYEALVLSHGDFHPPNILKDAKGQIQFIDWEYCSWSPPDRDLAALVVGISIRQPLDNYWKILSFARGYANDLYLFLGLVLSEIIALLDIFTDNFHIQNILKEILEITLNCLPNILLQ